MQCTYFYPFPLPFHGMIQAAPALTNESRAVKFLCRRRLQTSLHTPYRRRSRNCTARSMFVKALRSSADLYWFAAAPPSFASQADASSHLSFPAHGAPTPFPVNINAPFLVDNSTLSAGLVFTGQVTQASRAGIIAAQAYASQSLITDSLSTAYGKSCDHCKVRANCVTTVLAWATMIHVFRLQGSRRTISLLVTNPRITEWPMPETVKS